jgi:enoyl-CoA hydratase/carnithine racemase
VGYGTLRYEVADDGVATIALDQPDTRNALSDALLGELLDALEQAREDDAVRCVVLTSSHETVFSSGGNLSGFSGDVPLIHKHFGSERFVRLGCSASSGSRRCAPRTGTSSPARWASRWRATSSWRRRARALARPRSTWASSRS